MQRSLLIKALVGAAILALIAWSGMNEPYRLTANMATRGILFDTRLPGHNDQPELAFPLTDLKSFAHGHPHGAAERVDLVAAVARRDAAVVQPDPAIAVEEILNVE